MYYHSSVCGHCHLVRIEHHQIVFLDYLFLAADIFIHPSSLSMTHPFVSHPFHSNALRLSLSSQEDVESVFCMSWHLPPLPWKPNIQLKDLSALSSHPSPQSGGRCMKSSPCSYIGLRTQTSGNTMCQQESLVTHCSEGGRDR